MDKDQEYESLASQDFRGDEQIDKMNPEENPDFNSQQYGNTTDLEAVSYMQHEIDSMIENLEIEGSTKSR